MNKRIILVLALSSLFSLPALARGGHRGQHRLFKQLDLTQDQKTKLKEIRESRKEEAKSLRKKSKEARKSFYSALESGTSDSKLKKLHSKFLDSKHESMSYRFETMLKTRELLTDEQKEKFSKLKSKMMQRFKDRMRNRFDED